MAWKTLFTSQTPTPVTPSVIPARVTPTTTKKVVTRKPTRAKKLKVEKKAKGKKKVGRPSKEEVRLRAQAKLEAENKLKAKVIETQTKKALLATIDVEALTAKAEVSTKAKALVIAKTWDGPVFMRGDRVKETTPGGVTFHGTVLRHDLDYPRCVLVSWDVGGCIQYHAATALKRSTKKAKAVLALPS